MQLHGELFPKIQFETQSRMLHHLDWIRWKHGSKKGDAAKTGSKKRRHPLASVAKKTLLTRIPRLVYHHHAQRKDEPTSVQAHEIVAMFRKRLVRRAAAAVGADRIGNLFLEVTKDLA